jgi:hypothetical protein
MMKMPKLSDLTDLDKLKEFGNSLVDSAKSNEFVNKVKSTVTDNANMSDLVNKVKSSVGLSDTTGELDPDIKAQAASIQASLHALFEAQKQQVAAMNTLKKQVHALLHTVAATSATEHETETTITSAHHPSEHPDDTI